MADQFLAEIRIFAGNFAPSEWAFCNGQLLPIAQNSALFSLIGTYYGGNGMTNFALPNLQGMAPLQAGQAPGLSQYLLGQVGGEQSVTLLQSEMPLHTHAAQGTTNGGDQTSPANTVPALPGISRGATAYSTSAANATLAGGALSPAGGGTPHNNMPPYLTLSFIIALTGIFPARG
jgi:microcystin-dependent protein